MHIGQMCASKCIGLNRKWQWSGRKRPYLYYSQLETIVMAQHKTFKGGAVAHEAASNGSAKSSESLLGYLKKERRPGLDILNGLS